MKDEREREERKIVYSRERCSPRLLISRAQRAWFRLAGALAIARLATHELQMRK